MDLSGVDTTLTLANEKVAADLKRKLYDEDGVTVEFGVGGEAKEGGKYKVKGSLDVKASDLGGAKLNMNVSSALEQRRSVGCPLLHTAVLCEIRFWIPSLILWCKLNFRFPLRETRSRSSPSSPRSTSRSPRMSTLVLLSRPMTK